jgi:hypothetical protein
MMKKDDIKQQDKNLSRLQYPSAEDIYNQDQKEALNEEEVNDDNTPSSLDVPGSELDNENETIGEEDEENNYYSIGGDDHNDLDEDNQ